MRSSSKMQRQGVMYINPKMRSMVRGGHVRSDIEAGRQFDPRKPHPASNPAGSEKQGLRERAGSNPAPAPLSFRPSVRFVVPGTPIGKPRMTQRDKWRVGPKARPCVQRYRDWADAIRQAADQVSWPQALGRRERPACGNRARLTRGGG